MSTLQVANITDGTDTVATGYVVNGSAKAWVNFNGTGTVAIRKNGNVSSITDNGVGDYTVNFGSAFADASYNVTTSVNQPNSSSGRGHLFGPQVTGAYSTSSVRLVSKLSADTAGFVDYEFLNATIHGDLA